jgi:dihydroorotate dehydrogenase
MPDWFYRTVSKPLLFSLPASRARDFALGFIGTLSRLPLGPYLIDFLGHMRADPRLRQSFLDTTFPTAAGIGPWLDTRAVAVHALSRFGVGFIEVGPVTLDRNVAARPIRRVADREAFWIDDEPDSISLVDCNRRLRDVSDLAVPVIVRLRCPRGKSAAEIEQESRHLIRELATGVRLVALDVLDRAWATDEWKSFLREVLAEAHTTDRSLLFVIAADDDFQRVSPLIDVALREGFGGVIVDGSMRATPDGRLVGLPVRELALQQVAKLRERFGGANVTIIASGGVHEPEHALELRAAGADLVEIDTGLVYTGPGLLKRINDCLLFEATRDAPATPPERVPELTWFWTTLMGIGMLIGGVLAFVIAVTKVVLPYDEVFLGISRDGLPSINPHLLDFMAHDRTTLAGVMLTTGMLYVALSVFGIRRGLHWARQTVLISASTGFLTFFLFLGFGYLDPFHAFVTAALLQLLLFGVHARLGTYTPDVRPETRSSFAWRLSLWGQLLLVLHGFALLGAGAVISVIGVTQVFVHEDLEFMRTTAGALSAADPRLIPLVAHDRATLGGMLLAAGWLFLLPALWGFRRGSAWLWWATLIAGVISYAAGIGVHYAVGYLSVKHLLPAFGGLVLMLVGLILSYSFLCRKE